MKLWHRTIGIGVAGNVAGHMAQAGEASADSITATEPQALFIYYIPPQPYTVRELAANLARLEQFPVTYAVIDFPHLPGSQKVQVEPELGLYCDIVYSKDRKSVESLVPLRVAAFNDCSIRQLDGSSKLSQKKNWGFASKGISLRSFPIDSFSKGTFVDDLAIVSYLRRYGETHLYSHHAPCKNYLSFNDNLLNWIIKTINTQAEEDKWEEIFSSLVSSGYPNAVWFACGAGEYTEWGATNYLQEGDEVAIFVYDLTKHPEGPDQNVIKNCFHDQPMPGGIVDLHQTFVSPSR